jgi:hypothetical protein
MHPMVEIEMVEPLSVAPPPSRIAADPPSVVVQVTYDYPTGDVTYSQTQVAIDASTVITLTLTTTNAPAGGDASLYGFSISANWPLAIQITFPSASEIDLAVPIPDTPSDTYVFTPLIQSSSPAGVSHPGSLQLFVSND